MKIVSSPNHSDKVLNQVLRSPDPDLKGWTDTTCPEGPVSLLDRIAYPLGGLPVDTVNHCEVIYHGFLQLFNG